MFDSLKDVDKAEFVVVVVHIVAGTAVGHIVVAVVADNHKFVVAYHIVVAGAEARNLAEGYHIGVEPVEDGQEQFVARFALSSFRANDQCVLILASKQLCFRLHHEH